MCHKERKVRRLLKKAFRLYRQTWFAAIFSLIIYVSITAFAAVTLGTPGNALPPVAALICDILTLVLQTVIFAVMVYRDAWAWGDRDRNAVQYGHIEKDLWRGFKIGCIAAIPSFLSFVFLIADKLFSLWEAYATVYRLLQVAFYPVIVWTLGRTVDTVSAALSWGGIAVSFVTVVALPVFAGVAYTLGYHQFSVGEHLVYKRKK